MHSPSERTQCLVLAAHGSHLSGDSAAPVYAHAARIRALGVFDQVVEAFWKEEPSLRDALDLVETDDAFVVPLFLAEGYFTRVVLPRELQSRSNPGLRVHHARPLGTHARIANLVLERATGVEAFPDVPRVDTTLIVVGHGTERTPGSGGTTRRVRDHLRTLGLFGAVECAFLDEAPGPAEVLSSVRTDAVVLIPFFLSAGWHAGTTLPRDLGIGNAPDLQSGRRVAYTPPIGTLDGVADLIVQLAAEVGACVERGRSAGSGAQDVPAPDTPARGARPALLRWVDEAGERGRIFMQLRLRQNRDGSYEMRHCDDAAIDAALLERHSTPQTALAIGRETADGRYRPLRSVPDLRRGWLLEGLDAPALWAALSWLYPAAAVRWHEDRCGALPVESFDDVAARQTGIYAGLGSLDDPSLQRVIRGCCGPRQCLRRPAWTVGGAAPLHRVLPEVEPATGGIACAAPCSVLLERAAARLPR